MPEHALATAEPQPLNEVQAAANDNPAQAVAVTPGFRVDDLGVWQSIPTKGGEEWLWFCSQLYVLAQVRDFQSTSWSLLVEVVDPDGARHQTTFPRSLVQNDSGVVRDRLSHIGLTILPTAAGRTALNKYLSFAKPARRITMVERVGWHGKVYVLPDAAFGISPDTEVVFQGQNTHNSFRVSGTLEDWKEHIGHPSAGNYNLELAICVALASVLLKLVDGESSGVNYFGPSSIGKSTTLSVAGSIWTGGGGGGAGPAAVRSWRLTDNALEGLARDHCDASVPFDEMGQIEPRALNAAAYMITNGQGKARANREGGARDSATWRMTFTSNGERSMSDMLRAGGFKPMPGQQVRVIDLPAVVEGGYGIFETLNGHPSGAARANQLKEAATRFYGSPARAFIEKVADNYDVVAEETRTFIAGFVAEHCPADADGQVGRVAERFALFAAAGELATAMEILPWGEGGATRGIVKAFNVWLAARGGTGPAEMLMAVDQVRERLERFSTKHFDEWRRGVPGGDLVADDVQDRWGFRSSTKDGTEFWVGKDGWKKLCEDYNPTDVAKELVQLGILKPDGQGRNSVPTNIPGQPKKCRYYHLVPGAVAGGENAGEVE